MDLGPDDIREILRIFTESDLEELRLDLGATRLHVSKRGGSLAPLDPPAPAPTPAAPPAAAPAAAPPAPVAPAPSAPPAPASTAPAAASVQPADTVPTADAAAESLLEIRSPLLGVFYRRPAPDKPAFVEIGATVSPDDPVCIVDVMKMFTQVPAGVAGRIVDIVATDGQLVEHGQVLMRVEPA